MARNEVAVRPRLGDGDGAIIGMSVHMRIERAGNPGVLDTALTADRVELSTSCHAALCQCREIVHVARRNSGPSNLRSRQRSNSRRDGK